METILTKILDTPLAANLAASRAPGTRRAYHTAWTRFLAAANVHGESPLPADPMFVAMYLSHLGEVYRPATVRLAAAAIGFMHRNAGETNPCSNEIVHEALAGGERRHGLAQKQARGLTKGALAAVVLAAGVPRVTRGGRLETADEARRRAAHDIAIVRTMRDGLLRRSEAAALMWGDVATWHDGTGRLTIRRSKTDQAGEGAIAFLSVETMRALAAIRPEWVTEWHSVFGLSASQIYRRIRAMTRAAGLGEGFSGHSARVGMSQDLVTKGATLPEVMTAGRWSNPRMVARYTEKQELSRGAVARFYGEGSA